MAVFRSLGTRTRLYETIIGEIEQMVASRQLKPGDVLPPERELARRFGVSRTAVREAVKVLSEKELVTVVRGKGAIVCYPSAATVSAPLSLLFRLGRATLAQLTEVRTIIEPEMAALAAARRSPGQATSLHEIVSAHGMSLGDPEKAASLDMAFHQTIWEAAQNEVAKALLESIKELLRESIVATNAVEGAAHRAVAAHSRISQAIRERDADVARHQMREHLDRVVEEQKLYRQEAFS